MARFLIFVTCCALGGGVAAQGSPQLLDSGPAREVLPPRHWTVDDDGPADFGTIQAAVDRARSGDVIRIRAGIYDERVVLHEGLTLLGDPGAALFDSLGFSLPSQPLLRIAGTKSSETVVLRGLQLLLAGFDAESTLTVEETAGPVWIEDCLIEYAFDLFGDVCFGQAPRRAMLVRDASAVVLVRSRVEGRLHSQTGGVCQTFQRTGALEVIRSSVSAFETSFRGVRGMTSVFSGRPGRGSDAAVVQDASFFYAADCGFEGGDGANGQACDHLDGQEGGNGLAVDASSEAHALACTFAGGDGGAGVPPAPSHPICPHPGGADGPDGVPVDPLVELLGESARSYGLSPDEGAPGGFTLTASGPAGDLVLSVFASDAAHLYLPLHQGPQVVAAPLLFVCEGTIPAGGVLTKPVALPAALQLVGFRPVFAQGFFFDTEGGAFLASGSFVLAH